MKIIAFILSMFFLRLGAQVTYVDIPDTTLIYPSFSGSGDDTNYIHFDVNSDAVMDFYFSARHYTSVSSMSMTHNYQMKFLSENNVTRIATVYPTTVTANCPVQLIPGDMAGAYYIYSSSTLIYMTVPSMSWYWTCNPYYTDKFYPLELTFSSQVYYGWIRVDFNNDNSLTIKDYAYSNIPNTSIQIPNFAIVSEIRKDKISITNSGTNWVLKELGFNTIDQIKVFSVSGQLKYFFKNNTSEIVIPNSDLESGLYLIEAKVNDKTMVVKAVK